MIWIIFGSGFWCHCEPPFCCGVAISSLQVYSSYWDDCRTALRYVRNDIWITMSKKQYCVYILTNTHHTVLYTGITNNLTRRVLEHRIKAGSVFTKKYNVDKLVYYESGNDVNWAILREKQIKAGSRKKKLDLINVFNPDWNDLFDDLVWCVIAMHKAK